MFSEQQQKIYDGLKSVGESLANFYADAIHMIDPKCTLFSKANLIAHLAREIDSGLRDVFAPEKFKKENEKLLSGSGNGHFASILAAVGKTDPENLIAMEWFSIASNFHRIAHRSKAYLSSKSVEEISELWRKYENVLMIIIGSYLSITNRLDVLLKQEIPQTDSLQAIKNLLRDERNENYFFSNLDKPTWLNPLYQENFFEPELAQNKTDEGSPQYWYPIKYLLSISNSVRRNNKDLLKGIIIKIMNEYINNTIDLHLYTISDITQILANLDNFSFGDTEKFFFEKYSLQTRFHSWGIVHNTLSNQFAKRLIETDDKEGLLNLLKYFFGFSTYEEEAFSFFGEPAVPYIQKKPFVEKFYVNEMLRINGNEIIKLLGIDSLQVAVDKLTELDELGTHSLTWGSPASIEPTSQTIYSTDWENYLVNFIRDYAGLINKVQLDSFIDQILYSDVQILQRLGIHLIRENFRDCADKWWSYIELNTNRDKIYIHEPYVLLQQYSDSFNDEQFEKTISWIELINPRETHEVNGKVYDSSAYQIRRWLTALSPNSQKSKELLNKKQQAYELLNDGKMIDHPEFSSYGTTSIGYDYPIDVEEFQNKPVEEQIDYIQNFKPTYEHDTSDEGLADILEFALAQHPLKYLYKLDLFLPLQSLYTNHLIIGITKALQNEKIQDYTLTLAFIESRLASDAYINEQEKKFPYKKWFGGTVSKFVSSVINKRQQLNLSIHDIDRLIDFLLNLLKRQEFQDESDVIQDSYINHVLNSITGQTYQALMESLQAWSQLTKQVDKAVKWPTQVRKHFTDKLSEFTNENKDFSIVLGMELPILIYLDKDWVEENVTKIFDDSSEQHFDYRMQTAFSRYYSPSFEIYNFYKSHNLFVMGLNYFKKHSAALSTLMVYALFEWRFWNGDPEKESLLSAILEKKDADQIKELIEVTFQQKILAVDNIIYLWKRLLTIFNSTPELTDSHSILTWLFELVDQLDLEVFNLITEVINKIETGNRDAYSLLKHLYKISDTNIELSGKILLQIYKKGLIGPNSYDYELQTLVYKIYSNGQKELADGISIAVSETGSLALKNIYNEHN